MSSLIIGCGYLGQRLATLVRARGDRVFATTRKPERIAELTCLSVEPIVCDVCDPGSLTRLPRVDTVVYCVALDRHSRVPMRAVYVEGLSNVLTALPGSPRVVYISSTSVYAQTDGREVDEDARTEPLEESGKIILEAEQLLQQRSSNAILLRFAGIYGPGRLIRAKDLQNGRLLAIDPEKWLNLIHVEDGARAILAATVMGEPGAIYNIADGHPVRRREFYTTLAKMLQTQPPRFVPPPEPVPMSEKINRRIGNKRMREELGVEPRYATYREGIQASR